MDEIKTESSIIYVVSWFIYHPYKFCFKKLSCWTKIINKTHGLYKSCVEDNNKM